MSYDIAVVIPPISDRDLSAWETLDLLIDQEGRPPEVFGRLHEELVKRYPCLCSLPDDEVDNAVWSSGPLWENFGRRAAVLGVSYSRVDDVLPFVVETAAALGLTVFDWSTNQIHRPNGIAGMTLTVENGPPLDAPTLRKLHDAVDALTPNGGPGFLVLQGSGDDYAQTAGGDGAYTCEWRECSGEDFHHWVAGHKNQPADAEVAIATNGFQVCVKSNERLSAADVKTILSAFAIGTGRPEQYAWRDVSERYV